MKRKVINTRRYKEGALISILILLFSYLFNFVWESFHSVLLYEGHNLEVIRYIFMINYASITDSFLILGVYAIIALLWKDLLWIKKMNKKQIYITIIIGLIIAAFIEYRAVFLMHRWSYNAFMPTILGIGLSPLIQLSITGILAFFLTKRLLYQKGIYYGR